MTLSITVAGPRAARRSAPTNGTKACPELSQRPVNRARSAGHDRLLGVATPRSHSPTALRITPSLAASTDWFRFACRRYVFRDSERAWGSFTQGGGTTLMARSTKWQKGRRRVPLRQPRKLPGLPRRSESEGGQNRTSSLPASFDVGSNLETKRGRETILVRNP